MVVLISNNHLKLLGATFMHISPVKKGACEVEGKYSVESETYGHMGEVVCISTGSCMLYEIKDAYMLLSEGTSHFQKILETNGHFRYDRFQISIFRFLRRASSPFVQLIEKEVPGLGIELIKQTSLFNG